MDRKIIATELYKIAKKISQNTVNEDELIDELTGISREFSSENISEIIPINFDSSSVSGIDTLLNNYQSFLAKKENELLDLQNYLQELRRCLQITKMCFDNHKKQDKSIANQCNRFKRVLSQNPKIRTKENPKSRAFFRKKDLFQ